jgi:hypothetical protein
METKKERFSQKLRELVGFLQRSCDAFDRGAEAEALRIATTLRVMFHDTQKSTSLVNHLGFKKKRMLSSARGFNDWQDYLRVQLDLSSEEPVKMLPMLGDKFRELSIDDWWGNETVFVHAPKRYSRRLIVLSAANRDGGAHVDKKLEKYYEVLAAGEYAFGLKGNLTFNGKPWFEQGVTHYARNAHLALIRQFGYETLVSVKHFNWLK